MVLYAAGRMGATDDLNLAACGLECDDRGRLRGRQGDLPDQRAAHLRGRRRDRLPEPRLDLDGAGPDRRLPRLRSTDAPDPPEFFPYGIYAVPEISTIGLTEEQAARAGHPLRMRHRALPRDLARPHHGARDRLPEDAVRARRPPAARRAHRRRGRHRADPHRPGGAQPAGHARLFRREHLQLSRRSPRPTRSPRSTPGTGCSPGRAVGRQRPAMVSPNGVVPAISSRSLRRTASANWPSFSAVTTKLAGPPMIRSANAASRS